MGKMGLAGASLIAAIPGGILFYLMLMAALHNLESMPSVLKAAAITLLVVSLTVAVFPFYILIWYGGKGVKIGKEKKSKAASSDVAETAAISEQAMTEHFAGAESAEFEAAESAEFQAATSGEFEEFGDGLGGEDGEDADEGFETGEFQEADEDFEFEEFDEDQDKE